MGRFHFNALGQAEWDGLRPGDVPIVRAVPMDTRFTHWMGAAALAFSLSSLGQAAETLPDPDGKPADMSKPVQVYILLGQSNMLGFGTVKGDKEGTLEHAVKSKKMYPYLADDAGNWTVRKDVRNVRVMGSGLGGSRQFNNEWMTIKGGRIGPEIGIGHHVGEATDAPVLILKSCIGNRALGWDLLPPGGDGFEFTDSKGVTWVHPGYKGSPERWKKGEEPKKIKWYAGMQYDGDIARAKKVLSELDKYYPGAKSYEVAGFFWWQGDRDSRSEALSSRYEKNLVHLIKTLRKDFNAPKANFVCASLGQSKKGATDGGGKILEAMLAVDGTSGKYPEFKGNVASVYTHPLSKGGSSGGHYGGNAETYMNVGEAMGKAMVELLMADK
ncbi:MAG: sialate O-acetylesterase [Verrucomicrobiota bacterium]|nr:sialate O-acetylesterase [Verrucomicrobiota bacterium]